MERRSLNKNHLPLEERARVRELTVGEGDDLARPLGVCHSPDILYRVGLALAGLSAEVVREVVFPGVRAIGSDPLEAVALMVNAGGDEGSEDELGDVKVGLYEGEAGEGGGEESHGEETSTGEGGGFIFYRPVH